MAVNQKMGQLWAMAANDHMFRLRMPEEMRQRLQAAASENNRSMNAEILSRLETTFAQPNPDTLSPAKVEALQQQIDNLLAVLEDIRLRTGAGR